MRKLSTKLILLSTLTAALSLPAATASAEPGRKKKTKLVVEDQSMRPLLTARLRPPHNIPPRHPPIA